MRSRVPFRSQWLPADSVTFRVNYIMPNVIQEYKPTNTSTFKTKIKILIRIVPRQPDFILSIIYIRTFQADLEKSRRGFLLYITSCNYSRLVTWLKPRNRTIPLTRRSSGVQKHLLNYRKNSRFFIYIFAFFEFCFYLLLITLFTSLNSV